MEKIFLGLPRYRFGADNTVEIVQRASRVNVVGARIASGSMTCLNCNRLLCFALNLRTSGFRWFALLHDDVRPEAGWLDKLVAEAMRVGADFLSAAVPYKSDAGMSSTSIRLATGRTLPLTQAQIRHPDFPDTFDAQIAVAALARLPEPLRVECDGTTLWCNTGCMVCRIDRDWDWTRVAFQMRDLIEFVDGEWRERSVSEDFVFSEEVAAAGGRVFATRTIDLGHYDEATGRMYRSTDVWGQPNAFAGANSQ